MLLLSLLLLSLVLLAVTAAPAELSCDSLVGSHSCPVKCVNSTSSAGLFQRKCSVEKEEAGSGSGEKLLIMASGGPGMPHDYMLPLRYLSCNDSSISTLFYDQGGVGLSANATQSQPTLEAYTAELNGLVAEQQHDEMHLIGHSWGGFLVLSALAAGTDSRVKSAMLLSPVGPKPNSTAFSIQANMRSVLPGFLADILLSNRVTDKFYRIGMESFSSLMLARLGTLPDCLVDSIANMKEDIYSSLWGPSEWNVTGSLRNVDLTPALARISIPVYVNLGEFDEMPYLVIEELLEGLPQAAGEIIQGASHSIFYDAFETVFTSLTTWLKDPAAAVAAAKAKAKRVQEERDRVSKEGSGASDKAVKGENAKTARAEGASWAQALVKTAASFLAGLLVGLVVMWRRRPRHGWFQEL